MAKPMIPKAALRKADLVGESFTIWWTRSMCPTISFPIVETHVRKNEICSDALLLWCRR